jgi:hypothetical protein
MVSVTAIVPVRARPRALACLVVATLLAGAAAFSAAAPAHAASAISVFAGYGASPGFPSPWQGDTNVNFQGAGPAFDAGAVRIDNSTGSPVTVDRVTVDLSSTHFDLWPADMVIPAASGGINGHLILTQTSEFNFDTSDVGVLGGCQPDGIVPVIHVTVGGVTTDYRDTAQIINTGGVDRAACPPPGSNEHIDWALISVATSLAYTGDTTQDFRDGTTLSARLTTPSGAEAGQPVSFTLGSQSCTGTTDGGGLAACSLTLAQQSGGYVATASFGGGGRLLPSQVSATYTITTEETSLAYTGTTHVADGTPAHLSGVLTEDGATPIGGHTVTFTLGTAGTAQSCSGATDGTGTATCTIASVDQPVDSGRVLVAASFAGDGFYRPASASATALLRFMTGRAYGLGVSASVAGLVNLTIAPTPDTGQVTTASATTVAPPCVATITGVVSASTLCASVTTTVNPGTSTAAATLADVSVGIPTLPAISAHLVRASSRSVCVGASGATTIASLTIGGTTLTNLTPAPNTAIALAGGGAVILNEQIPMAGADAGLTVNAIHVFVHTVTANVDVIISSATSDIHNCGT